MWFGNSWSHYTGDDRFNMPKLIDNYNGILKLQEMTMFLLYDIMSYM